MADKDLLGIIADMLRKLDQHSEILERQSDALKKQTEVLTAFMDGTVKQFDQQTIINEKLINRLDNLEDRFNRS